MDTLLRAPWTVDEFLAWEDRQEGKHEFDGFDVIEMTGGSVAHQRIVFNLVFLLYRHLPPVWGAVQEMRIRIGNRVRYPDVSVFPAPVAPATKTLSGCAAVFEVLSDDTAATDRSAKLAEYAEIPGIRCYVLLEQHRIGLTVHRRHDGGWSTETLAGGTLALPEIGVAVPVGEIYAGLQF